MTVNAEKNLVAAQGSTKGAYSIAHELRRAITGNAYGPGQKLPTERQLAMKFGSSRTTVRKALAMLEQQKLVDRREGSGTYVTYRGNAADHDIAERTSPLELIEVRAAIEPQIARLAVLHASARDLERMQLLIRDLEAAAGDNDASRYSEADEQFHLAIAQATSNPLMVWLYEQINEIRTHSLWAEMREKVVTRENMRIYNDQHEAVVRAIQRRDAAAAAEEMVRHMEKARNDLIGAHSR
jgi:DNA-binding FadR family transcriptional regulator